MDDQANCVRQFSFTREIARIGVGTGLLVLSVLVSLAIGFGSGVVLARVVRAEMSRVLGSDYVLAASAAGSSTWRTVWRHLLPNVAPVVIVQLSLVAALAVLAEATLSYLGLTPVSTPSWGRMLSVSAAEYAQKAPHLVLFPGIAISLAVFGSNLFGDALRDTLDPRLRGA